MKVYFDGEPGQHHSATGLDLIPGEMDVPDDKAEELLKLKIVTKEPRKSASKKKE